MQDNSANIFHAPFLFKFLYHTTVYVTVRLQDKITPTVLSIDAVLAKIP